MSQYSVIEVSSRSNVDLLPAIHRLRHRVFRQRLNWSVVTSEDMEIDHYDVYQPLHLAVVDENRTVMACTRLVSTLKPYMLKNTFPILLGGRSAPCDALVYEASRFAVDAGTCSRAGNGLRVATSMLLQALAEWSITLGLTMLVAVVDVRMERILSRSGWPIKRYSDPVQIGETPAIGGELPIYDRLLDDLCARSGLSTPVLKTEMSVPHLLAS